MQTGMRFPQFQKDIKNHLDNLNAVWQELTKSLEDKLTSLAHSDRG